MESILTSIKKLRGIDEECIDFDANIIICINSALMILNQLGVGPKEGFAIEDDQALWSDFLGENNTDFQAVKSYIDAKVHLMFDPPQSATLVEALEKEVEELGWRLNANAEFL